MTSSDFPGFPLQMEALIEDSIGYIINHEDSQRFVGWMCEHIDDYYTGPDMRQGGIIRRTGGNGSESGYSGARYASCVGR